jgi:hypothetical protein
MKKRLAIILSLVIIVVIVVSAFVAVESYKPSSSTDTASNKKPFYVGVTYCGGSVQEAEQLVNKVKSYTNLLVIQSGDLQNNLTKLDTVCDYAVHAGLNIIAYFGTYDSQKNTMSSFISTAQTRWGSHFLGIYYGDEPGGKMLDDFAYIGNITKYQNGAVDINLVNGANDTNLYFDPSGEINVAYHDSNTDYSTSTNYFMNGTITHMVNFDTFIYLPNGTTLQEITDKLISAVTDAGNISQFVPRQELWNLRPLQTYSEAATAFIEGQQDTVDWVHSQSSTNIFTSDYALDWYDYAGGYDVVLGQLGWNQSTTQNIALVRGAADMQNKSWGTIIDWQSQVPIVLPSGDQMYSEMKQSYESGATYVVAFNYSPGNNGTGLLQKEQFSALQKFWSDVVRNPKETNNVTGQDALVLPSDYGWGMRNQNDTIWGLWGPDNNSQAVWNALQSSLSKYGSKLDIVYDDPTYPVAGRYQHVYYWNQTI